ncbi:hypothetical protein GQX74_006639 [Glossina fuscipes]|nr:hypothetical protein GQX74_006639 [Glossina fuscipes]
MKTVSKTISKRDKRIHMQMQSNLMSNRIPFRISMQFVVVVVVVVVVVSNEEALFEQASFALKVDHNKMGFLRFPLCAIKTCMNDPSNLANVTKKPRFREQISNILGKVSQEELSCFSNLIQLEWENKKLTLKSDTKNFIEIAKNLGDKRG